MARNSSPFLIALAAVACLGVALSGTVRFGNGVVHVTAVDGDRAVRGLTEDDFELRVDGQRTPFVVETPDRTASVLVLAENTQHLREVYGRYIPLALETLTREAPMASDYMLATYGRRLAVQVPFGYDVSSFGKAYQNAMPAVGGSALWDSVSQAIELLEQRPGRRALVLLTSGEDASWTHTPSDIEAQLERTDVVLYVGGVGVGDRSIVEVTPWRSGHGLLSSPEPVLRSLAEKSGGGAWFAMGQFAMPTAMSRMIEWFDSQYRLVFTPDVPADGTRHELTIRASWQHSSGLRRPLRAAAKSVWYLEPSS